MHCSHCRLRLWIRYWFSVYALYRLIPVFKTQRRIAVHSTCCSLEICSTDHVAHFPLKYWFKDGGWKRGMCWKEEIALVHSVWMKGLSLYPHRNSGPSRWSRWSKREILSFTGSLSHSLGNGRHALRDAFWLQDPFFYSRHKKPFCRWPLTYRRVK